MTLPVVKQEDWLREDATVIDPARTVDRLNEYERILGGCFDA